MNKNNNVSLRDIKNQNEKLCILAVTKNSLELEYVKDQTEEICMVALKNTNASNQEIVSQVLSFIKKPTLRILVFAYTKYEYAYEVFTDEQKKLFDMYTI